MTDTEKVEPSQMFGITFIWKGAWEMGSGDYVSKQSGKASDLANILYYKLSLTVISHQKAKRKGRVFFVSVYRT